MIGHHSSLFTDQSRKNIYVYNGKHEGKKNTIRESGIYFSGRLHLHPTTILLDHSLCLFLLSLSNLPVVTGVMIAVLKCNLSMFYVVEFLVVIFPFFKRSVCIYICYPRLSSEERGVITG